MNGLVYLRSSRAESRGTLRRQLDAIITDVEFYNTLLELFPADVRRIDQQDRSEATIRAKVVIG